MALSKSKFHISLFSRFLCPLPKPSIQRFFSAASLSDDEGTDDPQITPTSPNPSPCQSQISDRFHFVIKEHHRINPPVDPKQTPPSLDFTIPSLSQDFSLISESAETLTPPIIAGVIKKCASVHHGIPFLPTLAFFNWAINREEFAHSPEIYYEMMDFAGKVRHFDLAWHIIELMKSRVSKIPIRVFTGLILRYVRASLPDEAISTFNRMVDNGFKPDLTTLSIVISVLSRRRRPVQAQALFDAWKDKIEPDVVVYTSLLNGWCKGNKIEEAERIFREMKEAGIEPNVYTYSALIDGLSRRGLTTRAHDVFTEMIDKGCPPNAVTFNNMMRSHVKAGETEKVLQLYKQMSRLGCSPDLVTFNFLIECHCRSGNRDAAINVLNQMKKNGVDPDAHSFHPILSGMCQGGDEIGAHRLYKKMKQLDCKPIALTYNVLMNMFLHSKSIDMILKLKTDMDEEKVEPNINTYKPLITLFCQLGHWNYAYMLFRELLEEKCMKPPMRQYEMVLEQLRIAGQQEKHDELVEKMINRGYATLRPLYD